MLDSIGLTIQPCGLRPSVGGWVKPSRYPASWPPPVIRRSHLPWGFSSRLYLRRRGRRVWRLASRPAVLWGLLPDELKQTIASDLKTILSEVLYGHHSRCPTASSPSQSRDLHSAIHRSPGAHQHRKSTTATRHA